MNEWVKQAILKLEADNQRSADTHLIKLNMPSLKNIDFYLKDESTHPSGSLKHRLARSLFLYGLCNGLIEKDTHIIEASSGSTAVSEAYFSRLLGLSFTAVVPESTSQKKIDQITLYGGSCHFVNADSIYQEAEKLAKETKGRYMDQFTFAERATDWRGNNNIADSIFAQMKHERFPIPSHIVVSAGTGGTSATIGRYIRYKGHDTLLHVADPTHSVFYDFYHSGDSSLTIQTSSNIEEIGRPRVELSFIPSIIDGMTRVPDEAAFAMVHILYERLNRRLGGSTGTNLYAAFQIAAQMQENGEGGSIVSMICDSGERYADTYFNHDWLEEKNFVTGMNAYKQQIEHFFETGNLESHFIERVTNAN